MNLLWCPTCHHRAPEIDWPRLFGSSHAECPACEQIVVPQEVVEPQIECACGHGCDPLDCETTRGGEDG